MIRNSVHCSKHLHVKPSHNIRFKQLRRSKTHIVVAAALATLSACAPLAEVRETDPRVGTQHGTRAEQAIAGGQELQRKDPRGYWRLSKGG